MRRTLKEQTVLVPQSPKQQHSRELEEISNVLDERAEILESVRSDLVGTSSEGTGREGLSADQVLRAAIIRQTHGLSYRELEFHLSDSRSFRRFVRLGFEEYPSFRRLQSNIKKITAETWEQLNRALLGQAKEDGIEPGQKLRTDCTVVDSDIHHPTDSGLLWDCVRVVTRLMSALAVLEPRIYYLFTDHTRRAKRRSFEIAQPRGKNKKKSRRKAYLDLIKVSSRTLGYARRILEHIEGSRDLPRDNLLELFGKEIELDHYVELMVQVLDQTRRRVIDGEKVPSSEKIVSIFEPHTDIIVKDRREVQYGHKICLTGGTSSLIIDCVIEEGNPADSTLAERSVQRASEILGHMPKQVSFDGGFASKKNVAGVKKLGVEDVAFHKKRGIEIEDMVKNSRVFKQLRNFRAGIEGCISTLKRAYGLGRCIWRGLESFRAYVWNSVVSYNLMTLARHRLTEG